MVIWFAISLGVIFLSLLLYWLLVTTEGVYLGRRVVVWLYDRTAHKYDRIKEFDPAFEELFLARPLLKTLVGRPSPRILDVATGTGRLPLALLDETTFNGRLTGLDPARKMLDQAEAKLRPFGQRINWVQATAVPLPFPDNRFDAVTCLEALEFLPDERAALSEMVRVLRPGGTLLVTRRTGPEARAFPRRYRSRPQMAALLASLDLVDVQIGPWQYDYDQVFARKRGVIKS